MKFFNAFRHRRSAEPAPREPTPMDVRQLARLERLAEAGAVGVRLTGHNDGKDTALEQSLHGKEMTIEQARDLVIDRGHEIPRVAFVPIDKFGSHPA